MKIINDIKARIHPASSDASGTATSSDPSLVIEARFGLVEIVDLLDFYDNAIAQDVLAVLLTKAAQLVQAAGGIPTPALNDAVAATQAVTPAPTPDGPVVAPSAVVGTPAEIVTPAVTPAVVETPAVTPAVVETPAGSPAVVETPAGSPAVADPTPETVATLPVSDAPITPATVGPTIVAAISLA